MCVKHASISLAAEADIDQIAEYTINAWADGKRITTWTNRRAPSRFWPNILPSGDHAIQSWQT